jgi:hypothetical protein
MQKPALVLFLLALSCAHAFSEEPGIESVILGTWEMTGAEVLDSGEFPITAFAITFTAANTFKVEATVTEAGQPIVTTRSGSYRVNDSKVIMHTTESELEETYLVKMHDDLLTMTLPELVTLTLKRTTPEKPPN